MTDLTKFLDSLGDGESEGEFTVDYQTALQHMARYQLGDMSGPLEALVMSAVAGGAYRAQFRETEDGLLFSHDGVCPDAQSLETLFLKLFDKDDSLRYLAMAVNFLIRNTGPKVTVWSQNSRFTFTRECLRCEPENRDHFQLHFHLKYGPMIVSDLARKARFLPIDLDWQEAELPDRSRSFELDVGGFVKLFDPGPQGDHILVTPGFGSGRRWSKLAANSTSKGGAKAATTELKSSQGLQCAAILALQLRAEQASEIVFFRHGLELSRKILDHNGFLAYVGTEQVDLDLSNHQVVENERYQKLLEWLHFEQKNLRHLLSKAYPTLSFAQAKEAARLNY